MSGFTKEIIIQTFMELLNEKPLAKITVKDIVEKCGVNRNTFYYHFRDIPDVVEFAMKRELDKIIDSKMEVNSVTECLELVVGLVKANQKAMFHIYRSVQRESFVHYLDQTSLYIITQYFDKKVVELELSGEDRYLIIKLYKCVFVGAVLDWLDNGMEYDLCAYMRRIVLLEGSIRKML